MKDFRPANLVQRRKQLGMTQQALADSACVSVASISKIENGKAVPKADTLARLSEALMCRMEYFFGQTANYS